MYRDDIYRIDIYGKGGPRGKLGSQFREDGVAVGFVEPHDPSADDQLPTFASTSALRNRSTTSMKPTDGTSRIRAVIEAIW